MTARDLNAPMPSGRIVDASGTPTLQFQSFIQRIWQRTGNAPGQDMAWLSDLIDAAVLRGVQSQSQALIARSEAEQARLEALLRRQSDLIAQQQSALDTATIAIACAHAREDCLQQALDTAMTVFAYAQSADARAAKTLETAQDSAILAITARQR